MNQTFRQRKPRPTGHGGANPNRAHDSNGPTGRNRGTPTQLAQRYEELALEARLRGDRVLEQAQLQHAEHYRRVARG